MDDARTAFSGKNDAERVRDIVSRHHLPDFVSGFDVRLGEFAGDPALWVIFKTSGDDEHAEPEMSRRLVARKLLRDAVEADLLRAIDDRWPYLRFEQIVPEQELPI